MTPKNVTGGIFSDTPMTDFLPVLPTVAVDADALESISMLSQDAVVDPLFVGTDSDTVLH